MAASSSLGLCFLPRRLRVLCSAADDSPRSRVYKLTKAKEDAQVRARILSEVERYLEIEKILAIDGRQPAVPRTAVRRLDDVEEAAEQLRRTWKLGEDAIPNLCEFLEDKGIKICAIPLPASVSGVQAVVTAARGNDIPVIVINSGHPDRQRFTLAHELGHLCLDVKGHLDVEDACHRFAGAFLVPAKILRREVGGHRSALPPRELFGLKRLFGMSAQAIAYRCRQLGIISQPTLSSLFKLFARRGWRLNEPGDLKAERPARFERLCIRALAEGYLSEAKASELLRKTVKEVVASMDEPPPELSDAFALALAKTGDHILLAGDASLRAQAEIEDVECHGVLWILDALEGHGILPPADLLRALTAIAEHPRCRLPNAEIQRRVERYRRAV